MSGIGTLANSAMNGMIGQAAGAIGNQIGYGIGNLTGYNESLRNDQLKTQQALTGMQYAANYNLMKGSYEQQQNMWDNTNAEAQIKHYKEAGLNPALMYAKGGAGGSTGSGGTSVGGGQAANAAQMQAAQSQQAQMGIGMMKMESEIELNKAQARNLEQDAKGKWIENNRRHYTDFNDKQQDPQEGSVYEDKHFGSYKINNSSINVQNIVKQLDKTTAEAMLTNQKAQGYVQELANAIKNSDSQATQAAAQKLAAEFNYGEEANWKWWVQMASNTAKIIK